MKKFRCYACGNRWLIDANGNGHYHQRACPKCGSDRVQIILDSLISEIKAGVSLTNPAAFCIPYGSRNKFKIEKWMTD